MKKFILALFIFKYSIAFQATVLAEEKALKENSLTEVTLSIKEVKSNYQTKVLAEFINYNSKLFKTTEFLLNTIIVITPQEADKKFLSHFKKNFFKESLYLSQVKYLGDGKIQTLSKEDKTTIIAIRDFQRGSYTYEGHLLQFDWKKTITENLFVLANQLKSDKNTLIPTDFFNKLIFPSAHAVAPVAFVSLIKSAFSLSRLTNITLWMLSFQTMRLCQEDDFKETKYKPETIATCIGVGLLWPAYWGFKLLKRGQAFADEIDSPQSEIEQFMKITDISCPRSHQKEKQMKVSFSGDAIFLDVIVNYDENFRPVNILISEGKELSKKEDSAKIFVNGEWKKQAVKKLKEKSYFEIEEAVLLKSTQSFSGFCKSDPDKAEKTLKEMIKNTQFSTETVPSKRQNPPKTKIQTDQRYKKDGNR